MKKYRVVNETAAPIAINLAAGLEVFEPGQEKIVEMAEDEYARVKRSAEYAAINLTIEEYVEKEEEKPKKEAKKPKSRKKKEKEEEKIEEKPEEDVK